MIVNEREIRTKNPNVENAYCFIFELTGKGHEPSRAENPSARVMARASSARTHH